MSGTTITISPTALNMPVATNSIIDTVVSPISGGGPGGAIAATDFRPAINNVNSTLDTKVQLTEAFLEFLTQTLGNCIVSGCVVTAATGLSVDITAFNALVGNLVSTNSTVNIGGFSGSTTNYLFARQDGTFYIPASGGSTPPLTSDGHGQSLLLCTVATNSSNVTAVVMIAKTFQQTMSAVLITTIDPTNYTTGDMWYNTTNNQVCVCISVGVVMRSVEYGNATPPIDSLQVIAASANYTIPSSTMKRYYIVAGGTNTITLPSAATHTKPISIRAKGTAVSIVPAATQTIEGLSSLPMTNVHGTDRENVTLLSDGVSQWYIVNDVFA